MSIINDALKKAGKERQMFRRKQGRRWFVWTGSGVICILGVVLAMSLSKGSRSLVPEQDLPSKAVASFPLREAELEPSSGRLSNFHLSGILYDQQKPLAIINDLVVEEGAVINEAKLVEILPDYVRLSVQGEEFTLEIE